MIYSVMLASMEQGVPQGRVYTASIEECQYRVLQYIEAYNLVSSNWAGGEVYDGLGNVIGNISYNGRFRPCE